MKTPYQKVRDFIVNNFLFGDDKGLRDETSFLDAEIIDSTGILELVSFLEEEFSIVVADEELVPENLDSLSSIVAFLERKLLIIPPPPLQALTTGTSA